MTRKFLIATTFRDFTGRENDQIQYQFLESLKRQTYKNWEVVVTTFGEKNVAPVLASKGIPHTHVVGTGLGGVYSHTEVMLNAMALLQQGQNILIWTTCDVILEDNFLQTVAEQFEARFAGTSHPHLFYRTLEAYLTGQKGEEYFSGMDLFFFDGDFLLEERPNRIIRDYPNTEYGAFECFLAEFAKHFAGSAVNIVMRSRVEKIHNDFEALGEVPERFRANHEKNIQTFTRFLADFKITTSEPLGEPFWYHHLFQIKPGRLGYCFRYGSVFAKRFLKRLAGRS